MAGSIMLSRKFLTPEHPGGVFSLPNYTKRAELRIFPYLVSSYIISLQPKTNDTGRANNKSVSSTGTQIGNPKETHIRVITKEHTCSSEIYYHMPWTDTFFDSKGTVTLIYKR